MVSYEALQINDDLSKLEYQNLGNVQHLPEKLRDTRKLNFYWMYNTESVKVKNLTPLY